MTFTLPISVNCFVVSLLLASNLSPQPYTKDSVEGSSIPAPHAGNTQPSALGKQPEL